MTKTGARRGLLAALVVLVAPVAGQSGTPPAKPDEGAPKAAPVIAWEQDFDAAMQRAATEKKPVFVAFLMDNEPANDETIKDHYRDPQIQKLLARFVCLVGCIGEHQGTETGCGKFPGLLCQHHQAVEKKARARWLDSEIVSTPQHVFCDPSGQPLRRKVFLISKPTLAKCLLLTLQDCGIDTAGLAVDFGKDGGVDMVEKERVAVATWLTNLDSRNLELREEALRGLAYAEDPRAMPAVLKHLGPKHDDMTRLAAIGAVGSKGNHQAVAPLVQLLGENKAPILAKVAAALESIQLPQATSALLAAAKKEKRDRVLGPLLRAAARCHPANAEIRDLCLKQLKSASAQLTGSVLVALGWLDPHEKIVAALLPQLTSKNLNTRGLAIWGLGGQRSQVANKALLQVQKDEKAPELLKILDQALRFGRGEVVENYDSAHSTFSWGSGF
ncbi:MAG: HEAT repeat domain-containing protein [Planctomycetota bacterium]